MENMGNIWLVLGYSVMSWTLVIVGLVLVFASSRTVQADRGQKVWLIGLMLLLAGFGMQIYNIWPVWMG